MAPYEAPAVVHTQVRQIRTGLQTAFTALKVKHDFDSSLVDVTEDHVIVHHEIPLTDAHRLGLSKVLKAAKQLDLNARLEEIDGKEVLVQRIPLASLPEKQRRTIEALKAGWTGKMDDLLALFKTDIAFKPLTRSVNDMDFQAAHEATRVPGFLKVRIN